MKNIEVEFKVLNTHSLLKLSSRIYQYLKDKNLLNDFQEYLKETK